MSARIPNGIFIGRFQPVHAGHLYAIKVAASQVDALLILIGSANRCRSIKNPWTYDERVAMIRTKLFQEGVNNVQFAPLNDYLYDDDRWINDVIITTTAFFGSNNIVMFGHEKEGNDYLEWFGHWKFVSVPSGGGGINATQIRNKMFAENDPAMPSIVMRDWEFYQTEQAKFASYPHPETLKFNCADAVVVCLGHVLMIERKDAPGIGTLALPGGFVERDETYLECALRELDEETNLRVTEKVLRGSIVASEVFDHPRRNQGVPRITRAFYFNIRPDADGSLPRANGKSDAKRATWMLINDVLNKHTTFDDHSDIISKLTGIQSLPAFVSL